jgi:hypothetical protein
MMRDPRLQTRIMGEELNMSTDRTADDESDQNIADRLIERVSDTAERISETSHAILDGVQDRVEQLSSLLHREDPTQVSQPIPGDVRPVRPKRHASTWLAWRDNRWVPVQRVKDVGWVWSE